MPTLAITILSHQPRVLSIPLGTFYSREQGAAPQTPRARGARGGGNRGKRTSPSRLQHPSGVL